MRNLSARLAARVAGRCIGVLGLLVLDQPLQAGEEGAIRDGSPGAVLRGRIERTYRSVLILTFGGGTNEVQRDIIAMAGLGMPHYKS